MKEKPFDEAKFNAAKDRIREDVNAAAAMAKDALLALPMVMDRKGVLAIVFMQAYSSSRLGGVG